MMVWTGFICLRTKINGHLFLYANEQSCPLKVVEIFTY
jgi:hypothetical protein